jgi:transposase-like protein
MKESIMNLGAKSSVEWAALEGEVRQRVQGWIQDLLEEEVTEFLGRRRHERREGVEGAEGYRNGYGKERRLTMQGGTMTVRRPRVRGLEARFESRLLPLFARRTREVGALLPELYLHGLAEGDFDLALRGLLGEDAPISASTVARLKVKWQADYESWRRSSLKNLEVVYLWADGLYVKAGLEKTKAALLIVIAALADGRKVVVAVQPGHRESTESWLEVLRDLKARGMPAPRGAVADGHLGFWGAMAAVYPEAAEMRCWNHRILNVLEKLPKKAQAEGRALLTAIPYAGTRAQAERLKGEFQAWSRKAGHPAAAELIDQDWERMVAFYGFPKEHWRHLRTTNVIESPFAAVRLRTDAAKRYKKVENATAVIFKMLLVLEKRFRRLNAPELLGEVYRGVEFEDGLRKPAAPERRAA